MSDPQYRVEPGEIVTPVQPVPEEAHLITSEHTISDILRFLIEYSSYDEVHDTLEMMHPDRE